MVREILGGQICYSVRWVAHWSGCTEDSRCLVRRKWLGRSIGTSWYCFGIEDTTASTFDDYARAVDNDQLLSFKDWCKINLRMSTIAVQESYFEIRFSYPGLCALLRGSWLWYVFKHSHNPTHYARWIPIHLPDMLVLHRTQPLVLEFRAGHFTIQTLSAYFPPLPPTRHISRITHISWK